MQKVSQSVTKSGFWNILDFGVRALEVSPGVHYLFQSQYWRTAVGVQFVPSGQYQWAAASKGTVLNSVGHTTRQPEVRTDFGTFQTSESALLKAICFEISQVPRVHFIGSLPVRIRHIFQKWVWKLNKIEKCNLEAYCTLSKTKSYFSKICPVSIRWCIKKCTLRCRSRYWKCTLGRLRFRKKEIAAEKWLSGHF